MKCPKCGKENEEGILFCEECDWRMDMAYKGEKMAINSVYFGIFAVVLGIVATITALLNLSIVALITGALGMFLSGYVQTLVRVVGIEGDVKKKIMIMASIGIVLSVVGFIYGLAMMF